jgi:hypothetical protein
MAKKMSPLMSFETLYIAVIQPKEAKSPMAKLAIASASQLT